MKYFGTDADDCTWYVRAWLLLFTWLLSHCPEEIKEIKLELTSGNSNKAPKEYLKHKEET